MKPPEAERRRIARAAAALAVTGLLLFAACHRHHPQSALHPVSEAAEAIATLWWVMFAVLAVAFVIVMAFVLFAIRRPRTPTEAPGGNMRFVIVSGIVIPGVILVGLLVYSLQTTVALRRSVTGPLIEVTGFQWWWDVRYPGHGIVTANEIHIPVGQPVRLKLRAHDVVHSFWIPNLHGKIDMLPEVVNDFWIEADRPGIWRGQCAEFCGRQHALMAFKVVALPRDQFDAWIAERQQQPPAPASPELTRGQKVFFDAACHICHTIRGTRAVGRLGPDLTHLGSRLTLAAGTVDNTAAHLAAWIREPQTIKPGNRMPPTPLEADDLNALVSYLQSLR